MKSLKDIELEFIIDDENSEMIIKLIEIATR